MNKVKLKMYSSITSKMTAFRMLLMVKLYEIYHSFEHLIVDKWMRTVVCKYDTRSGNRQTDIVFYSQGNRDLKNAFSSSEISHLKEEVGKLQLALKSKDKILADILKDKIQLQSDLDSRNVEITQLDSHLSDLSQTIASHNHTIRLLREEKDSLESRCLPESEIPSMLFYAIGDSEGATLRKISIRKSPSHTYKLWTQPGNTSKAEYYPMKNKYMEDMISNRNLMLAACEILSIDPNANDLVIIENGRAIRSDNNWIITSKSKIKLIES